MTPSTRKLLKKSAVSKHIHRKLSGGESVAEKGAQATGLTAVLRGLRTFFFLYEDLGDLCFIGRWMLFVGLQILSVLSLD